MNIDVADFKSGYLRMCKEQHVELQECVIKAIDHCVSNPRKFGGYSLNLSTHSISSKTCSILSKLLSSDRTFIEIKFNDCSLHEDGVRALAHGISENTGCRRLDLKGNSIRGAGAETLGRMLRQNTKLLCLCLEWNAIGLVESAFSTFCEGLAGNSSLQTLDLRSNQISHHGAEDLATALKRNSTLRSLDLRFNAIGLIGARALLSSLEYNKTVVKMMLAGNSIPGDLLKAIEVAVAHNADRASLTADHATRQHMLSSEIQQLNKSKQNEVIKLLDKVDQQQETIQLTKQSASERISRLQESLEERKQQFNNLLAKLSVVESELAMSDSRCNELNQQLLQSKEEMAILNSRQQQELKRIKEERSLLEKKLNKEIIDANEKVFKLETKLDDVERKCQIQQEQIFELKENLAHHQADLKLKQSQFQETISFEKQKSSEAYHEAGRQKEKEVDRIRKETEEVERVLKDRVARVEAQRLELEEELTRTRASMTSERMLLEEQSVTARQHIRNEEEQKRISLEEKLRVLQMSRDEVQGHLSQQINLVNDLQSRNSQVAMENESMKRRIIDLQQELNGKSEEMKEAVNKSRVDLLARIDKLEAERKPKEELHKRISELEKELSDLKVKQSSEMTTKNHELSRLEDKLKIKELELKQMKDADTQRGNLLATAIQTYISKSPYDTTT